MRETVQQPDPPSHICTTCGAPLRGLSAFCPSCGAALRVLTGRLPAAQLLAGRYQIEQLIARGGMGAVYRAEDTRLGGAPVAIKEMSSSFVHGDTDAFERAVADFRREAALLARLRHAHLPRVSDQFDEGGKHYLVMELIAGHTLSEELRRAGGRLPLEAALAYADQLCDVLGYLHGQNPPIIYRDLKPSNVMVIDGEPRTESREPGARGAQLVLIDFGIARFYRPGQDGDTAIYGTTGYAPPEQYGKGQTDARTDIYALGVLMHQLLSGHDPTSTPFALPPLRTLQPGLPPHVADAITRATAIERGERFADIAAFRVALRAPAAPQPIMHQNAQPAARPQIKAPVNDRRGGSALIWTIVGICIALLVAGALALGLLLPIRQVVISTPNTAMIVDVVPNTPGEPAVSVVPTELPEVTPAIDSGSSILPTAPPDGSVVLLRPIGLSATSYAAPSIDSQGGTISYYPENAVDGQPGTAWRVEGNGAEQWIELDFGAEVGVQSIGIIPGYDKIDPFDQTDRFFQNHIVKDARFEFSDGEPVRVSFAKLRDMQFVTFEEPRRTRILRVVIEATYPAPPQEQGGRDFTPISEVLVQGVP